MLYTSKHMTTDLMSAVVCHILITSDKSQEEREGKNSNILTYLCCNLSVSNGLQVREIQEVYAILYLTGLDECFFHTFI